MVHKYFRESEDVKKDGQKQIIGQGDAMSVKNHKAFKRCVLLDTIHIFLKEAYYANL